jgi:ion channel-forming bestrophin family protein
MAEDPSRRSRGGGAGDPGTSGFWREAFTWAGSASPRVLPRVAVFGLISALVCATSGPDLAIPVGPHEVAGAVLGLLLVLRTNAGYDRWWEARRLWGGIVNQTRNLALQALSYGPDDPRWREEVVRRTIAFAHVSRRTLRGERSIPEVAALLGDADASRIARAAHMPGAVARGIGRLLRRAHEGGAMSGFAFQQAEAQRALLIDHVGACERILKTPLARVYSIKIRRFIVLFLVTLNFAMLHKFESDWLVPPFLMLVAYPILSVDVIGVELENPFSVRNLGHLPLDDICGTIEANLLGLLAEESAAEPEGGSDAPGRRGAGASLVGGGYDLEVA